MPLIALLDHLRANGILEIRLTGAATVAGVAGWPITHSRSPRIHNYWLRKYDIDGVYVPFAIDLDGRSKAFRAIPSLGLAGMTVTVPHKETAYKAMDEVDRWAQRLKAVNTIVVRDGVLYGANTDAYGFPESLREAQPSWRQTLAGRRWAGGAARAIVAGLQDQGATDIFVANRNAARQKALQDELGDPVRKYSLGRTRGSAGWRRPYREHDPTGHGRATATRS